MMYGTYITINNPNKLIGLSYSEDTPYNNETRQMILCISTFIPPYRQYREMADRVKKELEEKRAKLVELRRARDERKALLAQAEKGSSEVSLSPFLPFCLLRSFDKAEQDSQSHHLGKMSMILLTVLSIQHPDLRLHTLHDRLYLPPLQGSELELADPAQLHLDQYPTHLEDVPVA